MNAKSLFHPMALAGALLFAATSVASAADGQAAYLANCAACHQPDGKGLKGAFPPLAQSSWLAEHSVDDAIGILLKGLSGPVQVNGDTYNSVMPPVAHLSDADIAAILTHVYSNFGNQAQTVTPAQVAAVRNAAGTK